VVLAAGVLAVSSVAFAGENTTSVRTIVRQIESALQKVSGFEAELETRSETPDNDVTATRTLVLSRTYGWKIVEGSGQLRREIINDLQTNIVYYPEKKQAVKLTARSPEVHAEFEKPLRELNPVLSLDRSSLKLLGQEVLSGESVYHLEGTTTTQFLQSGKPVRIRVEAWVSLQDGLPRKTIEHWEDRTGTIIYRSVKLRDDLTSDVFRFVPPPGVQVIDIGGERPEPPTAGDSAQ